MPRWTFGVQFQGSVHQTVWIIESFLFHDNQICVRVEQNQFGPVAAIMTPTAMVVVSRLHNGQRHILAA
jgi:hypothetical protein